MARRTILERFEEKYCPEPNTGCWLWTASDRKGYGAIWVNGAHMPAQKLSYTLYIGVVPEGMLVCHKCDTPSCVNPNHLFLGTAADNTADMVSKGRHYCGIRHHSRKLTPNQVLSIYGSAETKTELSRKFGVSGSTIGRIKSKTIWRHLHAQ